MNLALTPALNQGATLWRKSWRHLRDHLVPHERNHYQPHALHHRSLVVLSILLVTIKISSFSLLEFAPGSPVVASAITTSAVLDLTNQSRTSQGIAALTYNTTLEAAAQAKANDMIARQYFAHNTPDGKTPWTFFDAVDYAYLSAEENLAVHFTDVEPLQEAWMNSPGHKANILNSSFKEMGVGISRGNFEGHESIFVVEEFGNPAVSASPEQQPIVHQKLIHAQQASAKEAQPATPRPVETKAAGVSSTPVKESLPPKTTVQVIETRGSGALATPISKLSALSPQPIAILDTHLVANGNEYVVTANTTSNVAKLLISFGDRSKFFAPRSDGTWSVSLPQEMLSGKTLIVEAFGLQGNTARTDLGNIAPTFADSFTPLAGEVANASISVFGQRLNVQLAEKRGIIGVICLLLTALIIAIGVHRHIQHVRMIANTAFVVMFATFLLLV